MAKFCVKCGALLGAGSFCVKCGADMRNVAESAQPQTRQPVAQTMPPQAVPSPSSESSRRGMSTLAKLGIAAVAIIFVGGAAGVAGVYYIAHRVSQKVHEAENRILGSSSNTGDRTALGDSLSGASAGPRNDNAMGDVCRFLSKEEVSKAIGVEVVRTHSEDTGCNYFAKGTQADMTAKHVGAMMAARGADQKTQQMIQNISGGMFNALTDQRHPSAHDSSGEVLVFNFSVDQHAADAQMRVNAKGLSTLGDTQDIPDIGDQAFVSGDGLMMVRKGQNLIRIWYLTCPCGAEAVKPLAKRIAQAL